jgi:hypothetical protein
LEELLDEPDAVEFDELPVEVIIVFAAEDASVLGDLWE